MATESKPGFDQEPHAAEAPEKILRGLLERVDAHSPWWEDAELLGYVKRHASNPAVRAKVRDFCIAYSGRQHGDVVSRAQTLIGLSPADFASPKVRKAIQDRISSLIEGDDLADIPFLADLDPAGAAFLRNDEIQNRLEDKIMFAGNARNPIPLERRVRVLAGIASLGIPELFHRPNVYRAAIRVQTQIIYDGNLSLLDELNAAGIPTEVNEQDVRNAAVRAARQCVLIGDTDGYRRYTDRFDGRAWIVFVDDITTGYERLLANGSPASELSKFSAAFPQFVGKIRREETEARVSQFKKGFGLQPLIESGKTQEAERFAASAGVTREQFDEEVDRSIRNLLNVFGDSDSGTMLLRLRRDLRVPASRFQAQGLALVRGNGAGHDERFRQSVELSWNAARRIQRLSGLPDEPFAEAFADGQVTHIADLDPNQTYGGSDMMRDVPKRIRSYRNLRGMPAGLAALLEQRVGFAYLVKCFSKPLYVHGIDLTQMPYLDDPTIRRAAVEGTRQALASASPYEVGAVGLVAQLLAVKKIPEIQWAEISDVATDAAKYLLLSWKPYEFSQVAVAFPMPEETRRAILDETREAVKRGLLGAVTDGPRREEYFSLYGFDCDTFPLCDIPARELLGTKDPTLERRAETDPWRPSFEAILKLQARSANEEHDPWVTDFFPLLDRVGQPDGGLDRESPKDGALLVEYVKAFGMANLPNVARVFSRLKKSSFALLPESDQVIVTEVVGQKAARMGSENLINELRLLRLRMQGELLADRVPRKIETVLGGEMFLVLRGSTQWEQEDKPAEIFATWQRTVDAGGDGIAVAPGYEETAFAVPRRVRGERKSEAGEEAIKAVLRFFDETSAATPLLETLGAYCNHVATAASLRRQSGRDAWRGITHLLDRKHALFHPLSIETRGLSDAAYDERVIAYLERIAAVEPRDRRLDDYLLAASAIHLSGIAPEGWTNVLVDANTQNPERVVGRLAEFVTQYLKEHYLSPAQNPDHTGHAPFSETLRLALERAWHAEGDAQTNVLLRANARIAEIRRPPTRVSKDTMEIALVPVQGPLRIYAGDIGDACYSSQHRAMAEGAFPGVKAMVFVTNRGKGTERLAGSVLLVETRLEQ